MIEPPPISYLNVTFPGSAGTLPLFPPRCIYRHYPDVSPTPTVIAPLLDTTGIFLLIQNGIGVHTDLGNAIGDNKTILSGCAWIDTTTVDGGRTVEHGIMEDLVIGIHLPPSAEQDRRERAQTALDLVVETLLAGGGGAIPTQNIDAQRWRKNLWNIGFSTLCTLTRLDVASVLTRRSLSFALPLVTAIMLESVSVARACGIGPDLLPDGAVGETIGLTLDIYGEGGTATASFKPSMLVDLEAGRPLEIEGILGSVMRLAMEKNVATPNIDMAYKTLKIIQNTLVARTES